VEKKLVLHVLDIVGLNQNNKFVAPTQAYQLSAVTSAPLINDFTVSVSANNWRQPEFLPGAYLPNYTRRNQRH
jgi:hypothetical protein